MGISGSTYTVRELDGISPPNFTANLLTGSGIDKYFTRPIHQRERISSRTRSVRLSVWPAATPPTPLNQIVDGRRTE